MGVVVKWGGVWVHLVGKKLACAIKLSLHLFSLPLTMRSRSGGFSKSPETCFPFLSTPSNSRESHSPITSIFIWWVEAGEGREIRKESENARRRRITEAGK